MLCLGYILLKFRDIIPEKDEWKPVEGQYSELLTTGLAMGFMSLVVNFGTIVLQGAINGLGTAIVAAHTAARKVFDIFTVSLYCLGNAMTTFVSQNMGAGEPARIRRGIRHAVVIATGITTVLVIICFAFGRPVFTWLASTDNPTIVDSAVMYSRISIVFFYVLGPLFILRCSLQGMGRKVIPVCSSVVACLFRCGTYGTDQLGLHDDSADGGLFREAAGTDVAKVRLKWYNKHYIGCVHTSRNNAENTL